MLDDVCVYFAEPDRDEENLTRNRTAIVILGSLSD